MTDTTKRDKVALPKGQVRSSEINGKILNAVLRGEVYEIVRNKEPWGVFLIARPRNQAELQALVEKLTDSLSE